MKLAIIMLSLTFISQMLWRKGLGLASLRNSRLLVLPVNSIIFNWSFSDGRRFLWLGCQGIKFCRRCSISWGRRLIGICVPIRSLYWNSKVQGVSSCFTLSYCYEWSSCFSVSKLHFSVPHSACLFSEASRLW